MFVFYTNEHFCFSREIKGFKISDTFWWNNRVFKPRFGFLKQFAIHELDKEVII